MEGDMVTTATRSEATIHDFLARYGRALSEGNLPEIAGCWDVPAFVLADQGARTVNTFSEIEDFFRQAVASYLELGLRTTRPEVRQIEALGEHLFSVDVRWSALDAQGKVRQTELSRYLLLLDQEGTPRIRVAMSLPDESVR